MGDLLVNMRLIIPSNEAKLGMDFGPIIGQYGVNIKNFCDKFNDLSKKIFKGIPLRVHVNIYKDRNFDIFINGFEIKFFIEFFLKDKDYITLKEIYVLLILKKKINKIYFKQENINDFSTIRSLLNYIRASKIKCI